MIVPYLAVGVAVVGFLTGFNPSWMKNHSVTVTICSVIVGILIWPLLMVRGIKFSEQLLAASVVIVFIMWSLI